MGKTSELTTYRSRLIFTPPFLASRPRSEALPRSTYPVQLRQGRVYIEGASHPGIQAVACALDGLTGRDLLVKDLLFKKDRCFEVKFQATTETDGLTSLVSLEISDDKITLNVAQDLLQMTETCKEQGVGVLLEAQIRRLAMEHSLFSGGAEDFRSEDPSIDRTREIFFLMQELNYLYMHKERAVLLEALNSPELRFPFLSLSTLFNSYLEIRKTEADEMLVISKEIELARNTLRCMMGEVGTREEDLREGLIELLGIFGEKYLALKDYRHAVRLFSYGLMIKPNYGPFREKVVQCLNGHADAAIHEEQSESFRRLWHSPKTGITALWDKVKELTLIEELGNIPESFDGRAVGSRLDQVEQAVYFLNLLESLKISLTQSIEEDDFFTVMEGKALPNHRLDREAIKAFVQAYYDLARDDSTTKNDSTRKAFWLASMLVMYSRLLHGDESLDNWHILPRVLYKLLEEPQYQSARREVMALTTMHRNFGTLLFGEGTVALTQQDVRESNRALDAKEDAFQKERTLSLAAGNQSGVKRDLANLQMDAAALAGLLGRAFESEDPFATLGNGDALCATFGNLEELKTIRKYGTSILEHSIGVLKFIHFLKRGADALQVDARQTDPSTPPRINEIYRTLMRAKDFEYINLGDFVSLCRTYAVLSPTPRSRTLLYLVALFHDIGESRALREGSPYPAPHEPRGAILIQLILNRISRAAASDGPFGFSDEEVKLAQRLVYFHTELGTTHFTERSFRRIYTNPRYGIASMTADEQREFFSLLAVLNLADVFSIDKGARLSADKARFFIRIVEDPSFLEKQYGGAALFEARLRMFSSNPYSHVDAAKLTVAKKALAEIKNRFPQEYAALETNFGDPDALLVLDYAIFFFQSLRATDMVKLMFIVSQLISRSREEKGKVINSVCFTAPSVVAGFGANPFNEILKEIPLETIAGFSTMPLAEIYSFLGMRGIKIEEKTKFEVNAIVIDNEAVIEVNRYIKSASIFAAAWILSKRANVATSEHFRSLAFLHQLSDLPARQRLNRHWPAIRLLESLLRPERGQQCISLRESAEKYAETTTEDTAPGDSFIRILQGNLVEAPLRDALLPIFEEIKKGEQ